MKAVDPVAIRDVLLLSLAAGSADAAGFFGLGRVFTSNMTGNVVLLGVAIGQGHAAEAVRSVFVLVVFMLGVAAGVRLGLPVRTGNWRGLASRVIRGEQILLLLFALGWLLAPLHSRDGTFVLLGVLSLAMGLQTAALSQLGAPGVGTTAITGTISALVTGVVARIASPEQSSSRQRMAFQAGVLALYCMGAAASGLLLLRWSWAAGLVPLAAAIWVESRRPGQKA